MRVNRPDTSANLLRILFTIPILLLSVLSSSAQGTLFTYQGQLAQNGSAVTGTNVMKFSIWTAANAGSVVGTPLTNPAVPVVEGAFTVALDFGPGIFTGPDRWLEIGIGTNSNFTTLAPRQRITATPYAVMANASSNLLGALPAAQITGNILDAQLSTNIARLNTNQNFTATNTFVSATVSNVLSLTPATLTPSQGSSLSPSRSFLRLNPSGPINLSMTTAINNGSTIGAILILQGMHDINTVTLNDGANVQLALLSRVLGVNDTLTLIWNGSDWVEVAFANN